MIMVSSQIVILSGVRLRECEAARSRRIPALVQSAVRLGILRLRGFRALHDIHSAQDDNAQIHIEMAR
jgi:hypothetical protein